jgi:hypothetical protein
VKKKKVTFGSFLACLATAAAADASLTDSLTDWVSECVTPYYVPSGHVSRAE